MRGRREPQASILAFADPETRVPPDHTLWTIKAVADRALAELSPEIDRMYSSVDRPSTPPEPATAGWRHRPSAEGWPMP